MAKTRQINTEEKLEALEQLKTNAGFQLVLEKRIEMLEITRRRALSANTWEDVLRLQGEAKILQVDEVALLIREVEALLAERA